MKTAPIAIRESVELDTTATVENEISVGTVDMAGDNTNLDTTGTDLHEVVALGIPAPGGHVVGGTTTNPLRVDTTGTTTQPISASSLPLPAGAATEATCASIAAKDFATQTTLATISGKITTCNTGSIAGSVTANAGTNLNTSALALESGGNLATIAGDTTSLDGKVTAKPTGPTIYNKTMTNADTEYDQALPANTQKFMIKCRGSYDIYLSFTSGQSKTTYITIPAGSNYFEDGIVDASITLYIQCGTAAQVAEIVAWS